MSRRCQDTHVSQKTAREDLMHFFFSQKNVRLSSTRSLCLVICSSVLPHTVCCANTLCFAISMSPVDSTWRCVPHYTSWQFSAWGVMCDCMNLLYLGSCVLLSWCLGWASCALNPMQVCRLSFCEDQPGSWCKTSVNATCSPAFLISTGFGRNTLSCIWSHARSSPLRPGFCGVPLPQRRAWSGNWCGRTAIVSECEGCLKS